MSKTIETDTRLPGWGNRLLNAWPFCIDTDSIKTWAVAYDTEGLYQPGSSSLMYNGFFFFRFVWPFGLFCHVKWQRTARLQFGLGYKLNGRIGLLARYQSDAAAAAGVQGPNLGQASGFSRGTA